MQKLLLALCLLVSSCTISFDPVEPSSDSSFKDAEIIETRENNVHRVHQAVILLNSLEDEDIQISVDGQFPGETINCFHLCFEDLCRDGEPAECALSCLKRHRCLD